MTSTVTNYSNNINALYPIAGQDNDTQGFRDNFSNIKQSLSSAAAEISDLQINGFKVSTATNDLSFVSQIFRGVLKGSGEFVGEVSLSDDASTTINYLEGSYRKLSISTSTLVNVINWPPNNVKGKLQLELVNNLGLNTCDVNFISGNGTIKKSPLISLPIRIPATTTATTIVELWSPDNGVTVYLDRVIDTYSTVTTSTYAGQVLNASQPNITSVGTLTSLSVTGNVSASQVSGTVTTAAQPNITSVGTLTSLSVIGGIIANGATINGAAAIAGSVALNGGATVAVGDLVVTGGAAGEYLQTDGAGNLTFKTIYKSSAPTSSKGTVGDERGMMFANQAYVYICYGNYTTVTVSGTTTSTNSVLASSTTGLFVGQSLTFNQTHGGITAGTTYYITSITPNARFQISTAPGGSAVTLSNYTGSFVGSVNIWTRIVNPANTW